MHVKEYFSCIKLNRTIRCSFHQYVAACTLKVIFSQTLVFTLPLQIFDCPRLKFSEIPQRLTNLLLPPDPIVINHVIR